MIRDGLLRFARNDGNGDGTDWDGLLRPAGGGTRNDGNMDLT